MRSGGLTPQHLFLPSFQREGNRNDPEDPEREEGPTDYTAHGEFQPDTVRVVPTSCDLQHKSHAVSPVKVTVSAAASHSRPIWSPPQVVVTVSSSLRSRPAISSEFLMVHSLCGFKFRAFKLFTGHMVTLRRAAASHRSRRDTGALPEVI